MLQDETFLFGYVCTLRVDIPHGCKLQRDVFMAISKLLCAKVVGATSSQGFLIFKIKFGETVRLDSGNNRFSLGKSQKLAVMFPALIFHL